MNVTLSYPSVLLKISELGLDSIGLVNFLHCKVKQVRLGLSTYLIQYATGLSKRLKTNAESTWSF